MEPEVQVFEDFVGDWDLELTIQPTPGASPSVLKGKAQRRLSGGRWLISDLQADSGFEGHGVYGFDATRGRYVGVWADSMTPVFAHSDGVWDKATKTFAFDTHATVGAQVHKYREVIETRGDGTQLYRHLMPTPEGGEFEMIRIIYRRRAA